MTETQRQLVIEATKDTERTIELLQEQNAVRKAVVRSSLAKQG